jgi:transcriptional regulator with XRE-family HTH domain
MIADNLYRLRVYKAHITQRELSELSGVTNVAISCLERGMRIPQKATV